jgi:hypothetical protein
VITNYTIEPCVLMEGGRGVEVISGANERRKEEGEREGEGRGMYLEKIKNGRWVWGRSKGWESRG